METRVVVRQEGLSKDKYLNRQIAGVMGRTYLVIVRLAAVVMGPDFVIHNRLPNEPL